MVEITLLGFKTYIAAVFKTVRDWRTETFKSVEQNRELKMSNVKPQNS